MEWKITGSFCVNSVPAPYQGEGNWQLGQDGGSRITEVKPKETDAMMKDNPVSPIMTAQLNFTILWTCSKLAPALLVDHRMMGTDRKMPA
jgi:hypothetical protein